MDTIGKKIFENTDMTGTIISEVIVLSDMIHMGVHAVWTGAPTGDLYIEVSGEVGQPSAWEILGSVPVAGSGSQYWLDRNCPYLWCRLRYVPTAGTGTINASSVTKGDK